ncbi:hypothetical protein C8Q80DRAFT_1189546 [Daedaleopsis nitida]|nr:hypothetical protein C8Q80DRAFT_1189546 [Daedaleopsis nitida]
MAHVPLLYITVRDGLPRHLPHPHTSALSTPVMSYQHAISPQNEPLSPDGATSLAQASSSSVPTDVSGSPGLSSGAVVVIAVWVIITLLAVALGVFSCWRRARARRRAAAQYEKFSPPPSYRERSSRKGSLSAASASTSSTAVDLEAQVPELAYTSPPRVAQLNYDASLRDSLPAPVTYQGSRDSSIYKTFVEPPAPARMRSN